MNIHHTCGTPKILPKLGKITNLYIKTVQKVSEPFDVPVKKLKSRTTAKVLFCTTQTNKQCKHPKGKSWHVIFIFKIYKST